VQVKKQNIHVFTKGQGAVTYLLMSGSSTRFPVTDFEPLIQQLHIKNKVVIVDKTGYGWSDLNGSSREIDNIVEEYREALRLSGHHAPYTLVPHSLSGLEATYWAKKYPEEVRAIIGLDPAIPDYYEQAKLPPIGLVRLIARISRNSVITPGMVDEVRWVKANARKVKDAGKPLDTPVYNFISNRKGVAVKNWRELQTTYLADFKVQKHKMLECGHYVHRYEAKVIANEMQDFVNNL